MNEKRILNFLFAIVAALLLVNLGVMLSPAAHAIPTTQYKAVEGPRYGYDTKGMQQILDQQSAQGWQYVNDCTGVLIFKK
ncbi:MAG TPA: hypothetical protein VN951_03215 [Pyrinomonadaceae bacterium]|nr:hypothetical protein [Pyrinomonadaceae bacterium]